MLKKPVPQQTTLEMVSIEGLVPKDHLLRRIEAAVDFSFIRDRVAGLYCADNGRPALDPVLMFKALFIGYLFGVRSERRLVREIEVNVAYRWFLGLKLTDPVFDASTLSQNRRRRYRDASVAQDIFDAIVEQAIRHGLVDGTALYTDSTHLKANANKNRFDMARVAKSRADYWDALDAAIDEDRLAHGKKPLKDKPREPAVKETKVSRKAFAYDKDLDAYRCPHGELLPYATTDRAAYRHYKSDPAVCRACPLIASCTANAKAERTITRHVWAEAREKADSHRLTAWGKAVYKRRKETVERSFADAKQLFGPRYARFRGLIKVSCQCLLAAAAQNMKKIALALAKPAPMPA
ncbi:transposase [Rhodomicrobium lacus]|uniref:transposase n=1 Tax=Rhodomicrobium lacus TaxID=2498452 RepID=UPI000F8D4A34|nr:transposase [Rhodomicrobium lacus]